MDAAGGNVAGVEVSIAEGQKCEGVDAAGGDVADERGSIAEGQKCEGMDDAAGDVARGGVSIVEGQNDWLDIAHQNRNSVWMEVCEATEAPPVNLDLAVAPSTAEAPSVHQPQNELGKVFS